MTLSLCRYSAGNALALLLVALSLLDASPLEYLLGPAPMIFSSARYRVTSPVGSMRGGGDPGWEVEGPADQLEAQQGGVQGEDGSRVASAPGPPADPASDQGCTHFAAWQSPSALQATKLGLG